MPGHGSRYRSQLEGAIEATRLIGAVGFSWFGKRPPRLPRRLIRTLEPEVRREYVTHALAEHLYTYFYCKGFAAPMHWEAPTPSAGGDLVEALRAANTGRGQWSRGWVRLAQDGVNSGTQLSKDGVRFGVMGQSLFREGVQGWDLRLPKDLPGRSPGHYLALSDTRLAENVPIVRLYWNCTAAGSVALMRALTGSLNAAGIPFLFKVLDDPEAFDRCDTAVLYLAGSCFPDITAELASVHDAALPGLRPAVPALTKPLAPGLALAEDTDGGGSYGMHRCRILAAALIAALEEKPAPGERVPVVLRMIRQHGMHPDRPYLRPGVQDNYPHLPTKTTGQRVVPGSSRSDELLIGDDRLPAIALEVGEILAGKAIWDGDECTWLGSVVPVGDGRVYATIGPDLYSGTAGIARFLTELTDTFDDPKLRRTAHAAARRSLRDLAEVEPKRRIGLYDGWVGIAATALRLGRRDGLDELVTAANRAMRQGLATPSPELDLISGAAGAICGALEAGRLTGEGWLVEEATQLGDQLVSAAIPVGAGCSWRTINRGADYHLTGLSHGTAGIAYSLLALYATTGERRYLEVAEAGFEYERDWFDPVEQNWPDLRETRAARGAGRTALAYSTYWCHGAPGIALTRLLAYELTADPAYRREALAAARTTERYTTAALDTASPVALCHGLLGNAAVLALTDRALTEQALPDRAPSELDTGTSARRIARAVDGFGALRALPLGTPGFSPGLMLGLAGVGHAALLLAGKVTSSLLHPAVEIGRAERSETSNLRIAPVLGEEPSCPESRLTSPSLT